MFTVHVERGRRVDWVLVLILSSHQRRFSSDRLMSLGSWGVLFPWSGTRVQEREIIQWWPCVNMSSKRQLLISISLLWNPRLYLRQSLSQAMHFNGSSLFWFTTLFLPHVLCCLESNKLEKTGWTWWGLLANVWVYLILQDNTALYIELDRLVYWKNIYSTTAAIN